MREYFATFLKGFAMGAANVVPGVSGGTIALITGIYERLINALKSIDGEAIQLLCRFRLWDFVRKIDGLFLVSLMFGAGVSVITLARVLKYEFEHHPILVWSIFFGLIAASIPSVGKTVKRWSGDVIAVFLGGTAIAVSMAFLTPASENSAIFYLGLCGVAAMCSMIIPGLSGSFVLLLMGNYLLVLDSVNDLTDGDFGSALTVIIPVGVGAVLGLLVLSRLLSWLFRVHHDRAIGAVTGFVVGSLVVIWPWKDKITKSVQKGDRVEEKIIGFENWRLPDLTTGAALAQCAAVLVGALMIFAIEYFAKRGKAA